MRARMALATRWPAWKARAEFSTISSSFSHCGGWFARSGAAPYFSQSSKYALPPFSKSSSALFPPLSASSTMRCARRRWMSHCTFVSRVQVSSFFCHLVAGAEHVDELGNVRDHVVEARRAVRRAVEREHVDALEVELRRVDRRVVVGVVVRHLLEAGGRLFPVLRLEVEAAARVLDLDELLLPVGVALVRVDVANVPVEGLDHRLLGVGHVLLAGTCRRSPALMSLPTPGRLPVPFLSDPFACCAR